MVGIFIYMLGLFQLEVLLVGSTATSFS